MEELRRVFIIDFHRLYVEMIASQLESACWTRMHCATEQADVHL